MAKRYRIKTIEDAVKLVHKLPPERAAVFLKELPQAIVQQATLLDAAKTVKRMFGASSVKAGFSNGFVWIDDDKGESNMDVKVSVFAGDQLLDTQNLNMKFGGRK